jgi:hypothetical protein
MAFLIGDTIRLSATIKNLDGNEQAPAAITVTVYREDGATKLLDAGVPTLKGGTTAQYYYDWTIPAATLIYAETLNALWSWTGPHKKVIAFEVGMPI